MRKPHLRSSPVPLLVLENDLRIKTGNEAFYKTFQVEASETEGRLVYELGNGQWNIPKLRKLLEDILPKQSLFNGFEVTHEFESIGVRTMLLNGSRMDNEHGAPERIVLVIEDITERKQAEEAVGRAAEFDEAVMANMGEGLYTVDGDGLVSYMNAAAEKLFGWTLAEISGRKMHDVTHHHHRDGSLFPIEECAGLQVLKQGRALINYEDVFIRKDGAFFDVVYSSAPLRSSGTIAGLVVVFRDITERKQAEEALRRSEKLAVMGRLAATVAHEVNNPLESVTNLLYLARKDRQMSEQARHHLELAYQELDRVAHITRQTLGFYRESTAPVLMDVPQAIDELLQVYRYKFRNRDVKLEKELDGSLKVIASPGEFQQVFSNLLINALDALPSTGGRVRLRVRAARDWSDGGRIGVRISVTDTGSGIDRSKLKKIFEPFYTTKKDIGTGLGLWLAKNVVHKHKGRIRVRSRVEPKRSGTVFSVFWPSQADSSDNPSWQIA